MGNSGFCKRLTFGGIYFPERNRTETERKLQLWLTLIVFMTSFLLSLLYS